MTKMGFSDLAHGKKKALKSLNIAATSWSTGRGPLEASPIGSGKKSLAVLRGGYEQRVTWRTERRGCSSEV